MYQTPAAILNRIAQQQTLKTQWATNLFRLDQDELNEVLEQQADALEASGEDLPVILAYQKIAPVLAEQEAITRYILTTDSMALRQSLPDVETPDEAVKAMQTEHRLSAPQSKRLKTLLQQLPK